MEKERLVIKEKKIKGSTLIKSGSVVSTIGTVTIIEGLTNQHGELGSLGLLIAGCGVSIILTGVRKIDKL